jgi:type I restriction enzyme R subunit
VLAKIAKKKYQPRRLLSLDVDDHIDPTTREWITVDENGNMVFPEASEQHAAELGTKFEAWLLAKLDAGEVSPGEETWLRMIGSQFRANPEQYGGPDAEFMVEQFAFHPFQQLGGVAQAIRVFGDQTRLQALLDSLNEHMFADSGDSAGTGAVGITSRPAPLH